MKEPQIVNHAISDIIKGGNVDKINDYISEGKVILQNKSPETEPLIEPDEIQKEILKCLTMNARLPANKIGKMAGIKGADVYYKIKNLEKQYGLTYTTQLFVPPLGYYPYLILIKFTNERPDIEELKRTIVNEAKIQFAVYAKGEYDVIAYMLEESPFMAEQTVLRLRTDTALGRYDAIFYTTPLAQSYGYIHIRDGFFSNILQPRILHKKRGTEITDNHPLGEREFIVLRELNENGALEFTEIDKRHGLDRGTALYTYDRLKAKGIIVRPTINASQTGIKYLGVIFIKRLDMSKYSKTKEHLYYDVINNNEIVSRYALICEVGAPDTVILFMPIRGDNSIDKIANELKGKLNGVEISSAIVTENLVGYICMRRFDNEYSNYYNELVAMKKLKPKIRTNYENVIQHKGI